MVGRNLTAKTDWMGGLRRALRRPELVVFLPAITLAAFWYGGESWLVGAALGLPMVLAIVGSTRWQDDDTRRDTHFESNGNDLRGSIASKLDSYAEEGKINGQSTLVLLLHLDDLERHSLRFGPAFRSDLVARCAERLRSVLRSGDLVQPIGDKLCVLPSMGPRVDLESAIQISTRLQSALEVGHSIDGIMVQTSASIGFCVERSATDARDGRAMLAAAEIALDEAVRNGPGGIRSFTPEMEQRRFRKSEMRDWLETALDEGQIRAYFQPQVSTDTGDILGFEALARWHHPERGQIPPGEFLPLIEESGLSDRLCEVMVTNALNAIKRWDQVALRVPTVAVNFSAEELRDPRLADRLKWELDRFDLSPARLSIEVLENVVAQNDNDVIVTNIAALSRLGCGIDLDDFGTGHASITSIRRFAVKRLKIDRSFVTRLNEDAEQQKLVSAILSMAERLGLETLAEGVETPGEHAILSQLGCSAVQGFGIGRPMPFDETIAWVERYREKLARAPRIRNKSA